MTSPADHAADHAPLGKPCACMAGLPCDGPRTRYRTAPKHGARVVEHGADCRGHAPTVDTRPVAPGPGAPRRDIRVTFPDVPVTHGGTVGRDGTFTPAPAPAPEARQARPDTLTGARDFAVRRQARPDIERMHARARAAREATRQTVAPALPSTRSARATLNTTFRGGASRAVAIREASRRADPSAHSAPLTGRARREAKRAAHQARLRQTGGDA